MSTQQPIWNYAGHVGDVDPIAYGGGFIYTDTTGVYGPEMTWFDPASDEQWHVTEGKTPVQVYRVLLENDPENEWWWDELEAIAQFAGQTLADMQAEAKSDNPIQRALVYYSLIHYHGPANFDSYPVTMTEDEAYARYTDEMKHSLGMVKALQSEME